MVVEIEPDTDFRQDLVHAKNGLEQGQDLLFQALFHLLLQTQLVLGQHLPFILLHGQDVHVAVYDRDPIRCHARDTFLNQGGDGLDIGGSELGSRAQREKNGRGGRLCLVFDDEAALFGNVQRNTGFHNTVKGFDRMFQVLLQLVAAINLLV